MTHTARCRDANRFGDGFDCICDEEPLPRALARIEELERIAADLKASYDLLDKLCIAETKRADEAEGLCERAGSEVARLTRELERANITRRVLFDGNLWQGQKLERIENYINSLDEPWPEWATKVGDMMHQEEPPRPSCDPAVHVVFHIRMPNVSPEGYREALPGDGYGFVDYVEGFGLRLQLDCGSVIACTDISYDVLQRELAKAGYSIWPMVCGDSRAASLKVGDTFRLVPTIDVLRTLDGEKPRALVFTMPLPGFPGHAGAVHEMRQALEVWGITLQLPYDTKQGDDDGNR